MSGWWVFYLCVAFPNAGVALCYVGSTRKQPVQVTITTAIIFGAIWPFTVVYLLLFPSTEKP